MDIFASLPSTPKPLTAWQKALLIVGGLGAAVLAGVAIAPSAPVVITASTAGKILAGARWGKI
jgi:hypothetical protein